MFGRKDVERLHTERRIHPVPFLPFEIDDQFLVRLVVVADLAEPPAPVDAIGAGFHGLQLGFGGLEGRVLGDERLNGFGIHSGGGNGAKGSVEPRMGWNVKPCILRWF